MDKKARAVQHGEKKILGQYSKVKIGRTDSCWFLLLAAMPVITCPCCLAVAAVSLLSCIVSIILHIFFLSFCICRLLLPCPDFLVLTVLSLLVFFLMCCHFCMSAASLSFLSCPICVILASFLVLLPWLSCLGCLFLLCLVLTVVKMLSRLSFCVCDSRNQLAVVFLLTVIISFIPLPCHVSSGKN